MRNCYAKRWVITHWKDEICVSEFLKLYICVLLTGILKISRMLTVNRGQITTEILEINFA